MEQSHILLQKYIEPNRPFCKLELSNRRKFYLDELNLDFPPVYHSKCEHQYLCKRYGKKKQLMKELNSTTDIGNCSVCWALHHTPFDMKYIVYDLSKEYKHILEKKIFNHYEIELEKFFHSWLYKK